VAIKKIAGADRVIGLFCFGGSVPEYVTPAGSIIGHPAVREVVAVGAVDVGDAGLDTVEAFSSEGPVELYHPARETRPKPDLVAFDGVSSATAGFDPFFGTSAAAPDSAAVAALMLQRNACRSPAQIQDALMATAVDIAVPGIDPVAGAGRVDALAAVDAVPPPTCTTDADCDDDDRCTADACVGCSCEHHAACDDGDACTIDGCDPDAGCTATPIEGFDGVACVCNKGLGADACSGTTPPRGVRQRFEHACRLVARAAGASRPARAHHLVARAVVVLRRAERRAADAARRAAVGPDCADALGTLIDHARARAARLADTL
jgi:hypothetical protein